MDELEEVFCKDDLQKSYHDIPTEDIICYILWLKVVIRIMKYKNVTIGDIKQLENIINGIVYGVVR